LEKKKNQIKNQKSKNKAKTMKNWYKEKDAWIGLRSFKGKGATLQQLQ